MISVKISIVVNSPGWLSVEQYINIQRNGKTSKLSQFTVDGKILVKPGDIAEGWATYFERLSKNGDPHCSGVIIPDLKILGMSPLKKKAMIFTS
jgi:hypothetical protein